MIGSWNGLHRQLERMATYGQLDNWEHGKFEPKYQYFISKEIHRILFDPQYSDSRDAYHICSNELRIADLVQWVSPVFVINTVQSLIPCLYTV